MEIDLFGINMLTQSTQTELNIWIEKAAMTGYQYLIIVCDRINFKQYPYFILNEIELEQMQLMIIKNNSLLLMGIYNAA